MRGLRDRVRNRTPLPVQSDLGWHRDYRDDSSGTGGRQRRLSEGRLLSRRCPSLHHRPRGVARRWLVSRWRQRARLLPSIARLVAPGTMDAGLSAVAGFVVAIYAARTLSVAEFGEYGLLFAAVVVARDIPQQLYFAPARIRLLELPASERLGAFTGTLVRGLPVALVSASFVPLAGFALASQVELRPLLSLGLSAAGVAVAGPLLDHQRASFHHSQRSSLAMLSSVVSLTGSMVALLCASQLGIERELIPFGSIVVGATVALLFGAIARQLLKVERRSAPSLRSVRTLGMQLVANQLLEHIGSFVAALAIGTIVSAEALGYAEGARVVGQPLLVLATGIQAVLQPRLLEAGRTRDRAQIRYYSRVLWLVLVVFALPYMAIFGMDHALNPLARLTPVAYGLSGLPALYILHNVVSAGLRAPISVVLGMERAGILLRATALAMALSVASSVLTAPLIGGNARIVGPLLSLFVRGTMVTVDMRHQLDRRPAETD